MSTLEVARRVGISYRQIDHWIRRGYIVGVKSSGSGYYRRLNAAQVRRVERLAQAARLKATPLPELADRMTECGHVWRDGWGEHRCHLLEGHDGPHRCECDFTERSA